MGRCRACTARQSAPVTSQRLGWPSPRSMHDGGGACRPTTHQLLQQAPHSAPQALELGAALAAAAAGVARARREAPLLLALLLVGGAPLHHDDRQAAVAQELQGALKGDLGVRGRGGSWEGQVSWGCRQRWAGGQKLKMGVLPQEKSVPQTVCRKSSTQHPPSCTAPPLRSAAAASAASRPAHQGARGQQCGVGGGAECRGRAPRRQGDRSRAGQ